MGYGEVGGGGSVHWVMVPGSGGSVGNGVDQHPPKGPDGKFGGGKFRIRVNGQDIGEWPIKDDPRQIQIYWTPHEPGNFNSDDHDLIKALRKANRDSVTPLGGGVVSGT